MLPAIKEKDFAFREVFFSFSYSLYHEQKMQFSFYMLIAPQILVYHEKMC